MKVYQTLLLAAILNFGMFAVTGMTEDSPSVIPTQLEEVVNPTLRGALEQYSPNYDSLPRESQIAAFDHVYTEMNGRAPYIPPRPVVVQAPAPEEVIPGSDIVYENPYTAPYYVDPLPTPVYEDYDPLIVEPGYRHFHHESPPPRHGPPPGGFEHHGNFGRGSGFHGRH